MSEAYSEQFPDEEPCKIIRLPGIISDIDLGLQEYSGDLLRSDAFHNPALRHDMTDAERQRIQQSNDNIWEG